MNGEAQYPCCLRSSLKSVNDDLVSHLIFWCWSTVLYQVQVNAAVYQDVYEHLMLPSAEMLSGDADLIFQQDMAPAGKKTIPA